MTSLLLRDHPLASSDAQRLVLEQADAPERFSESLRRAGLWPLRPTQIEILQVNVGKRCNQTCAHCHVDAGPDRNEIMSEEIVDACLQVLEDAAIPTLDITGGAPELHPAFRRLVRTAHRLGRRVVDRCNLTILQVGSYDDLPQFLAEHQVEIVASLPATNPKRTDSQRGRGVFEASIDSLRRLNELGYGSDPRLVLNLVTNPVGAYLPGNQAALEADWKRTLKRRYDVDFNALFTITNMPISRFLEYLVDSDNLQEYMTRLVNAFNPQAAAGVMCRNTLSVGWDGRLYDCDFNQMLDLPVESTAPGSILEFDAAALERRGIAVGQHCYGCTAGGGSSCGGAIS
jgi:radical SAM/Cys-rich protein